MYWFKNYLLKLKSYHLWKCSDTPTTTPKKEIHLFIHVFKIYAPWAFNKNVTN